MAVSFSGVHFAKEIIMTASAGTSPTPWTRDLTTNVCWNAASMWITRPSTAGGSSIAHPWRRRPPAPAPGVGQLADGQDVYQSEGHVAVSRSGSRQIWPDH